MSDAKANAALSESPTVEPSLPCIVDGTVAVRMERYASTVESTLDQRDLDSGVDEEVVRQSSSRHSLRQPVCEEAILPVSKDLAVPQVIECFSHRKPNSEIVIINLWLLHTYRALPSEYIIFIYLHQKVGMVLGFTLTNLLQPSYSCICFFV